MIRVLQVAAALCLGACTSLDTTPIWVPGAPVPKTAGVPEPREVAPVGAERSSSQSPGIIRYQPGPKDPSVKSKTPLSGTERRALQRGRQNTNAEIRALERRERFDGDNTRAIDERRLRDLKSRRRSVIRRLRGD